MIYLDSSILLARLFTEAVSPSERFWSQPFTSSRLLEYDVMSRINLRADATRLTESGRAIMDRVQLIELSPVVLARALAPYPVQVKTLDGLHLATMDYLRANGQSVRLASYDKRLIAAAHTLGIAIETSL